MAVIRMKKADLAKVSAYENLTDALVKHDGGDFWIVDTPQENTYFYSFADLMEYINENLECMRELVECGQIEPELWREAWEK